MNTVLSIADFHLKQGLMQFSIDRLDIGLGEFITITGENGSGKTSLIECLYGAKTPIKAQMMLVGLPPSPANRKAINEKTGWVLSSREDYPPRVSVRRFLEQIKKFYATWDEALERQLLESFKLNESKELTSLSLGEHSKLKLLKAICFRPQLLILDELTANLSPDSQQTIVTTLIELFSEGKMSVLCISHASEESWKLSDRIYTITNNHLQEVSHA